MTTLVTGASGTVGRSLVSQLVQAGEPVRAMTRDPAAAREVVDLAGRAGVRRVTVLSSGSVTAGFDTDYQLPVEQAVEASGLEWTHLRPGEFAANRLALWGPSVRAERVVRWPFPDEVGVPIHEADIAAVAVLALLEDGHAGRAYDMTGPATLSVRDQVAAIAAAIGADVRLDQVSRPEALRLLQEQGGWAAANGPFLLGYEGFSAGEEYPEIAADELAPLPTVEQVTGRPARSFARWALDHAGDFR
ncbi:MAG TPA: NmrA family NAD(P)-binding protein [Actinomycetota bacterium]|nr:NmrA family NAD(P)-binding protein [Actinomycetota bacterium]